MRKNPVKQKFLDRKHAGFEIGSAARETDTQTTGPNQQFIQN